MPSLSSLPDPATTLVNVLAGTFVHCPSPVGTCISTTLDTSAASTFCRWWLLPEHGRHLRREFPYGRPGPAGEKRWFQIHHREAYRRTWDIHRLGELIYVLLTHSTLTAANGSNAAADDITGMSVNSADLTTSQYCATDWVIRLTPSSTMWISPPIPLIRTLRRTVLIKGQTPTANGLAGQPGSRVQSWRGSD